MGLYLTLDTLYDTRLATLEMIDPRLVKLALQGNYMTRQEDSFPMVDKETFAKVYEVRDTEVLDLALPTDAFRIIYEFLKQAVPMTVDNPWGDEAGVYLNVWPYKIDRVTAQNMLEPIMKMVENTAHVHILNMTNKELTPQFCGENFGVMAVYDYQEWLEEQSVVGNFPKVQIPNVTLVAPKLYGASIPTEDELREIKRKTGMDPFRTAEFEACGLIGLQYAEIQSFCAALSPEEYAKILER